VNGGLELAQRTGPGFGEAELRTLRGELALMGDDGAASPVAQCFPHAIEVARRQSAKSWELRATTSLARLPCDTDRREEARTGLVDIYN
jgi:hypothetical protein